jgi:cytochrome c oxidase cbb3-type subunit 3
MQMQKADEEKEAYLAKAGNMVDENSVKMLDEAGIAAGKTIFTQKCAACHAPDGGGTVGPNLTDDYWLHGGSISSVFKTIKYGVPEKGMLSWKDQLSPKEIAQVTSFIKSIKGAKVASAKEPQGELYKDTGSPNAADSTKKIAALK